MSFKKQDDGRWLVSVRPSGRNGPYIRRLVDTRTQAVRLESELLALSSSDLDNRPLSELLTLWYQHFGVNLGDGKARLSKLQNIVNAIGDCKYSKFTPAMFVAFRSQRLESGISKNTCNHDLAYLKAVFSKLQGVSLLSDNKLSSVAPLKFQHVEFSFLGLDEVQRLLTSCSESKNESLRPVVETALMTGARWGEVQNLTFSQLYANQLRFTKTKSLKARSVPVSSAWFDVLKARRKQRPDNRVFANCYDAFANAVTNSGISLPRGQLSHVLRHTFASHFVMSGRSIFDLQNVLGHSDPRVTMRYAHLAPDHLEDVVSYNPIALLEK